MSWFGPTPKFKKLDRDPNNPEVPWSWNVHSGGFPVKKGDSPDLLPKNAPVTESIIPTARSQVFEIPKQLDDYIAILDWLANGMGEKYSEDRRPGKEDGTWFVWLTWFDLSGSVQIDTKR